MSLLKPSAAALLAGLALTLAGCAGNTVASAPAPTGDRGGPVPVSATATPTAEAKKTLKTQFVRVVDGDTIEVRPVTKGMPNGEPSFKVHMLGVSAPDATACGGAESIAGLQSLFRNRELVEVTYEPTLGESLDEDGNTLAYVIIGAGVTQDIGLRMVREGFAAAAYPEAETAPDRFEMYASSGKTAMERNKGIWASCPAPKS